MSTETDMKCAKLLTFELEPRLAPSNTPPELVRDIRPGTFNSNFTSPLAVGDTLYFFANNGVHGTELWKSDGTSNGTSLVCDIEPGPGSSDNANSVKLTVWNNLIFFIGRTTANGAELWRSDGTSVGTFLCRDITPGSGNSVPYGYKMLAGSDGIYFRATNATNGTELWKSDGTTTGTVMVTDLVVGGASSEPSLEVVLDGQVYFTACTPATGREIWRTNGTAVELVADVVPGAVGSDPFSIVPVGGQVYFNATDPLHGRELWIANIDFTQPQLVADLNPGPADGVRGYDYNVVEFNNGVLFTANDGVHGAELWHTDGTLAGTVLVKDINPGPGSSTSLYDDGFHMKEGIAYFMAADAPSNYELWRSDGTSAGTWNVIDFETPYGGNPWRIAVIGSSLYFTATRNNNRELWKSDGSLSGSIEVPLAGTSSPYPYNLLPTGDRLFFTALRPDVGRELFSLREDSTPPIVASISSTSANGSYSTGQSVNITIQFNEPVTLADGDLNVTLDTGAVLSIAPFSGTSATATYLIQVGQTSPDLNVTDLVLTGSAALKDAAGNNANLALPPSNLANNANILVNPPPPYTGIVVNIGATQRSRLTRIDLTFSYPVNAATIGAITLTRTTPNDGAQVDVNNGLIVNTVSGMTTSLTLTFANVNSSVVNNGSLADGRWRLSIPSLVYQSPLNDVNLRRLYGDADNNGTINADDFAEFGNVLGATVAGSPFDFNNDGTIQADDFAEFGNRFGVSL